MLLILLLLPIAATVAILLGSPGKITARIASGLTLLLGLVLAMIWSRDAGTVSIPMLSKPVISLSLGMPDGLSVIMMLLSVIVMFAATMSGSAPEGREKMWYASTMLIGTGALGAFLSLDLFFFYAFHELALIPTFLMIGLLGRGERKEAAWKITIYLAFGSIVLLAGLIWLVSASGAQTFLFSDIAAGNIDPQAQKGIALLLIVGFGTLVSLFPFHSWAAPAYAAAPTPVAMLHAGVMKKFGLYGLIRLYPMVSAGLQHWLMLLIVLLLANIIWVGFITINQKRLDTMLANSSVMHMGYIFLALAALIAAGEQGNPLAIPAATLLMFAHGISIALLFSLAHVVEKKTGTLELHELGGLAKAAPKLAFLFGLAAFASIGLPGLANFSGEVLVFLSGFRNWTGGQDLGPVQIATIISLWGVVISAVYMLRAFRKTFHGGLSERSPDKIRDLGKREQIPAALLALALLIVGLYPNSLLHFFPLDSPPAEAPSLTAE